MQQIDFREAVGAITKLALNLADQTPNPVILIDGRAGSGKSTLASQLRDAVFQAGEPAPTLIQMDDLYPGWEGLRAGSHYLNLNILDKLSKGKPASWQLWDWEIGQRGRASEPGNGWREYSGGNILIIEGCGSLSRHSRELAQLAIWVEADRDVRRARWLERDGEKFKDYFDIWAAQEDEFYQTEKSKELADLWVSN